MTQDNAAAQAAGDPVATWAWRMADELGSHEAHMLVGDLPGLAITDAAVVESLELLADKLAAWERVGANRWRMTPRGEPAAQVPPAELREAAADVLENVLASARVILDAAGDANRIAAGGDA